MFEPREGGEEAEPGCSSRRPAPSLGSRREAALEGCQSRLGEVIAAWGPLDHPEAGGLSGGAVKGLELRVRWVLCGKHPLLHLQPHAAGNRCWVAPVAPPWQRMCHDEVGAVGVEPPAPSTVPLSLLDASFLLCVAGGAAMRAGVQEGDRIVKVSVPGRHPRGFSPFPHPPSLPDPLSPRPGERHDGDQQFAP